MLQMSLEVLTMLKMLCYIENALLNYKNYFYKMFTVNVALLRAYYSGTLCGNCHLWTSYSSRNRWICCSHMLALFLGFVSLMLLRESVSHWVTQNQQVSIPLLPLLPPPAATCVLPVFLIDNNIDSPINLGIGGQ